MVSFPEFFDIRLWKLQYIGLNELKPLQAQGVKQIVQDYYKKIRVFIPSDANIKYFSVEVKQYEEPLKQKKIKYSVHVRFATDFHVFNSESASFDLNVSMSWALKEIFAQVKKFKEKFRDRWRGKGRRKEFGEYVYESETREGLNKKQYKPKLVKR